MGKRKKIKQQRKESSTVPIADRLQAIYDHVPEIDCKGLCTDSCGMIPMFNVEFDRIDNDPFTEIPEGDAIRAPGSDTTLVSNKEGRCPLLKNGRCSVHYIRPLICRLWGNVPEMLCEWGCKPTQLILKQEAHVLLRELGELSEKD